ncbi:hypothetical protein [Lysobacter gummosus]|uniref:hypothetical protein n=1 Tax=Lysobacter gummosus TaxID=262324 RepID=UPI0036428A89
MRLEWLRLSDRYSMRQRPSNGRVCLTSTMTKGGGPTGVMAGTDYPAERGRILQVKPTIEAQTGEYQRDAPNG